MYLVQIIALAVYGLVMLCAMFDFRKTVITWIPMSLLFNPQVCVLYTGSAVALTVAVNLSLVLLYLTMKKKEVKYDGNSEYFGIMPFMKFMVISLLISSIFSVIPFSSSINKLIKSSIMQYGMLYVFFRCLNTLDDVKLFIKTVLIVAVLITVDGIIENFTHINPAGDFIYLNSPHDDDLYARSFYMPSFITGGFKARFGLTRCYSFFSLHIHFGVACAIFLFLIINILRNKWVLFNRDKKIINWILYICVGLLAIGVIFSNSKTPMLGTCLLLLSFYSARHLFNIKLMLPLVIGAVLVFMYIPDYINNFLSLTDADLAEEGGGSTIAMRQQQLDLILKLFSESPIWGNGINAAQYFSKNISDFEGILGAESCWFKLLADQGLLGCIAYIFMYKNLYDFSKFIIPKRILIFFLIAVLCMETTTGSINFLLWAPVFIVIRRYYQLETYKYDKI